MPVCRSREQHHEAQGRGVCAPVRAAHAEARDARRGRVDLPGGLRRADRMGRAPVHTGGHAVLVAGDPVPRMDILFRPGRVVEEHSKV